MRLDDGPRARHDAFSKHAFELVLADLGEVRCQHSVDADPQHADVWFVSWQQPAAPLIGLLGSLLGERCLLEIYRKTPGTDDLRAEVEKGLTLSRRLSPSRSAPERVMTWVLSPGVPMGALAEMGFEPDFQSVPRGLYRMASGLCLGLLVVSELPVNDDTMVLRLFGRGHHQKRALQELFDRKEGDRILEALWALVMRWRIAVENKQQDSRTDLDDEFIDNIAWLREYERQQRETAIAEGHAEGRAEGRAEGHAEGHAEGEVKGQEQLLDLVTQERLGRGLTQGERGALRDRLRSEGREALVHQIVSSSPEALARWLASPPEEPRPEGTRPLRGLDPEGTQP